MPRAFRIEGVLGEGGFGRVYRAAMHDDDGFVRTVALKVLDPEATGPVGEAGRRLRDEACLLGHLSHRALVEVLGFVRLPLGPALVLEHVDGVDARDLVRAPDHVPPAVALAIAAEIAGALRHAWEARADGRPLRLVHRDVKPSNVRITGSGEVKLLDLGAATAALHDRRAVTRSFVLGTPRWMAPERFSGADGPEADVFGLGLVTIELLTGRIPGGGALGGRPLQVLHEVLPERLASAGIAPDVVAALAPLLTAMTAAAPEARPDHGTLLATLRVVRRACGGPELEAWAAAHVVSTPALIVEDDPWIGRTLTEDVPLPPRPTHGRVTALAAVATLLLALTSVARTAPVGPDRDVALPAVVASTLASAPVAARVSTSIDEPPAVVARVTEPSTPSAPPSRLSRPSPPRVAAPDPVVPADPVVPVVSVVPAAGTTDATDAHDPGNQADGADVVARPRTAHVVVDDDAPPVRLLRDGVERPPGPVSAGRVTILADFGDGFAPAGRVDVAAGDIVRVRCSRRRRACGPV